MSSIIPPRKKREVSFDFDSLDAKTQANLNELKELGLIDPVRSLRLLNKHNHDMSKIHVLLTNSKTRARYIQKVKSRTTASDELKGPFVDHEDHGPIATENETSLKPQQPLSLSSFSSVTSSSSPSSAALGSQSVNSSSSPSSPQIRINSPSLKSTHADIAVSSDVAIIPDSLHLSAVADSHNSSTELSAMSLTLTTPVLTRTHTNTHNHQNHLLSNDQHNNSSIIPSPLRKSSSLPIGSGNGGKNTSKISSKNSHNSPLFQSSNGDFSSSSPKGRNGGGGNGGKSVSKSTENHVNNCTPSNVSHVSNHTHGSQDELDEEFDLDKDDEDEATSLSCVSSGEGGDIQSGRSVQRQVTADLPEISEDRMMSGQCEVGRQMLRKEYQRRRKPKDNSAKFREQMAEVYKHRIRFLYRHV